MHNLASAAVVACSLVAASANAQPRAEMCGVTFVRTPDDVRHEIERWLAAEPRCTTSIELRVIPTDGGLYLWAQRPDGRVHERLVPDAQTAGVLVASWAADDWVNAAPPPAPVLAPIAPVTYVASAAARPEPFAGVRRTVVDDAGATRWLALGVTGNADRDAVGVRGAIDVFATNGWRLGVAAQYGSAPARDHYDESWGVNQPAWYQLSTERDGKLEVTVSRAVMFGDWELAGTGGLGVLHTWAHATTMTPDGRYDDTHPEDSSLTFDVSAMLARRLTRSTAIAIGPIASHVNQEMTIDLPNHRTGWEWLMTAAMKIAL